MPRRARVVIEGAVAHLSNRFARGEPIFAAADDAERFVEPVRQARHRDGLTVLAWCLRSNHYHLAVRIGPVPLAGSTGELQSRVAAHRNRRRRASGPLWHSRCKAKVVSEERHLLQLIAYAHENPVRAGLVRDAAEHDLCGHRELLGKVGWGLVDVEGVVQLFGATQKAARRGALSPPVRLVIAGLAIARWRLEAGRTASLFARRPEAVPRWASKAAALRRSDPGFARRWDELDVAMAKAGQHGE